MHTSPNPRILYHTVHPIPSHTKQPIPITLSPVLFNLVNGLLPKPPLNRPLRLRSLLLNIAIDLIHFIPCVLAQLANPITNPTLPIRCILGDSFVGFGEGAGVAYLFTVSKISLLLLLIMDNGV